MQVSNITDRGYLGPGITLDTFGPLLKLKTQNPNATLVALFLNAMHEAHSPLDLLKSTLSTMERMRSYIPISRDMVQASTGNKADLVKFLSAEVLFRDFDAIFTRFKGECHLDEISKAAGLSMKSENTIVRPWPMRLRDNATQREFDVRLASGHTGSERYVEWKRAV